MSNIQNDKIKEAILDEIESMTVHEFQELLDKHYFKSLNDHLDVGIQDMIEILFEERSE